VRDVLFEQNGEGYTPEYVRVQAGGCEGQISPVLIERTEGALAFGKILAAGETVLT